MEVNYVNYGVANRYEDRIEVNRNLMDYPHLLSQIIKHEEQHTSKLFSMYDLKHDLTCDSQLDQRQLIDFILKHPSSWTQFLPITIGFNRGFKIYYDINKGLVYLALLLIMGGAIWIGINL